MENVESARDEYGEVDYHVRMSLLSYYSSQASSRGMLLITIGLLLATLGLANLLKLASLWGALVISAFVIAMFRTFFRMLYWGYLSHSILQVPATKVNVAGETGVEKGVADAKLKTYIFHVAAVRQVNKAHRFLRWFGRPGWEALLVNVLVWGLSFVFLLFGISKFI